MSCHQVGVEFCVLIFKLIKCTSLPEELFYFFLRFFVGNKCSEFFRYFMLFATGLVLEIRGVNDRSTISHGGDYFSGRCTGNGWCFYNSGGCSSRLWCKFSIWRACACLLLSREFSSFFNMLPLRFKFVEPGELGGLLGN